MDEQDIAGFRSRTAEALLVYLLMHPRRIFSRRRLAELFWEERSETQAAANLRTVLSILKKQLSDFLLIDRQTVAINTDANIEVDAHRFAERIQVLLNQPSCDLQALSATLALYQGDFLEGFYLSDSRHFQAWEVVERERLQQLAARGFQRWAEETMRRGRYEEAAIAAERLIYVDPYDEAGYCLHMEALLRQGRNLAALRTFRNGRAFLREELGVAPTRAMLALVERIQTIDWPRPFKVPRSATPLFGRKAELQALRNMILGDRSLVTILAAGGMGKTRLAIALAQEIVRTAAGRFLDGIFFVSLASLDAPEQIPTTLAQALSAPLHERESADRQVLDYLRGREILLLLDNFDHLITADSLRFLRDMVHQAPDARFLVTSRQRLGLAEETIFDLRGLTVEENASGDAIDLFLHHARRVRSGYEPDSADRDAIARFCRMVEGMPLAIQLAAAWMRHLSPATILDETSRSLDLLVAPRSYEADPHRSIRGVFALSWRQLSPSEQQTLARLAAFAGSFSQQAAQQVSQAARTVLFDLVDKSLLRSAARNRFDLHPLVRQYAHERLVAMNELSDAAAAHARYYVRQLLQAGGALQAARREGESPRRVLAQLREDIANLRAAWQWLMAHPQAIPEADVVGFVDYFGLFLAFESWYQEAIDLYDRALAIWRPSSLTRGRWLRNLAKAQFGLGLTEKAEANFQQALVLLDRPFPSNESRMKLGLTKMFARQLQRRAFAPREDLRASRKATPQGEAIQVYDALSRIFYYKGERTAFSFATLSALTLAEQINDRSAMARGYANMCIGMAFTRHHNWARYYRQRARHIGEHLQDAPSRAYVLLVTGVYDGMVGEWGQGRAALQEAQDIYQKLGDRQQWGESFTVRVAIDYAQGRFSAAAEAWGNLAREAQATGNRLHQAWGLTGRSAALLALGETREANRLLRRSIELLMELDSPQNLLTARSLWSLALFRLGRHALALDQAEAAYALLSSVTPTFTTMAVSYSSLAETYLGLATLTDNAAFDIALDPTVLLARSEAITTRFLDFSEVVTAGKPRALIYRGLHFWQIGRESEALHLWRRAVERAWSLAMPYEEGRGYLELALHSPPSASASHLARAQRILEGLQASYELSRLSLWKSASTMTSV